MSMTKFSRSTSSLVMLIALTACGEPQIEYEAENPSLHGQVVRFSEPMAYMVMEPLDNVWRKETIEIGRVLDTLDSTREWNEKLRPSSDRYVIEEIEAGRRFTIKSSFWRRWNELTNPLSPDDYHGIILEDEQGVLSTMSIRGLANSDRSDLVPPLSWEKEQKK